MNALDRSVATAFFPRPWISIVEDGRLCIAMITPLGRRTESLNLMATEEDGDPQGRQYSKVRRVRTQLVPPPVIAQYAARLHLL